MMNCLASNMGSRNALEIDMNQKEPGHHSPPIIIDQSTQITTTDVLGYYKRS